MKQNDNVWKESNVETNLHIAIVFQNTQPNGYMLSNCLQSWINKKLHDYRLVKRKCDLSLFGLQVTKESE